MLLQWSRGAEFLLIESQQHGMKRKQGPGACTGRGPYKGSSVRGPAAWSSASGSKGEEPGHTRMGRPTFPVSGMNLGDGNSGLSRGYPRCPIPFPSVCRAGILPMLRPSTCQCASLASSSSQCDSLGQDLDGSHIKNGQQVLSVSPCKTCPAIAGLLCWANPIPHP